MKHMLRGAMPREVIVRALPNMVFDLSVADCPMVKMQALVPSRTECNRSFEERMELHISD